MKAILLGILLGFLLVGLSRAEDLPACCGATTQRFDLPGRTNGWGHNLPPQDAVRFGQQSLHDAHTGEHHRGSESHISKSTVAPEATYAPNFGASYPEEGGYHPGTEAPYTSGKGVNPLWYRSNKEWATDNLKQYWNLQ